MTFCVGPVNVNYFAITINPSGQNVLAKVHVYLVHLIGAASS